MFGRCFWHYCLEMSDQNLDYNLYFKPVYICFNTSLEFEHYGHIIRMVYAVSNFLFQILSHLFLFQDSCNFDFCIIYQKLN